MLLTLVLASVISSIQPDVARVRTLLDELNRLEARADSTDNEALQAACTTALGGTLQDALPDLFNGNIPRENVQELKNQLKRYVQARLQLLPAPGTSTPARREAVAALARDLTSRNTAVQLMSAWLGLAGAGGPPGTAQVASMGTGARKALAAAVRPAAAAAASESRSGVKVTQLRSDAGPGLEIAVDLSETYLLEDVGGPGTGNGRVDGGEWIHLRLGLKNRSARPWFSTSALFDAEGGCLAVPPAAPVLVAEMLPGATGALDTWVYNSARCTGDARKLSLTLRDTHRGGAQGTAEVLVLGANEVAWPALANPRLDADAWGFSDGQELPRISPDERFELSTGLSLAGVRAQGVRTRFSFPADLAGLFRAPPQLQDAPLIEEAPGQFIPADDADLVTVSRRTFDEVVTSASVSKPWVGGAQGGTLWLAVDTELAVAGAPVPAAPVTKAPTAAPLAPAPKPAPAAEAVAKLAREFISLVARPKAPSLPNGVDAAEGYEAMFNAAAFMERYRALVSPPAVVEDNEEKELPAAEAAGTRYTFRTFYALPLAAVAPRPPPPPPPPPRAPPPPSAPREVSPPAPVAREVMLRIDALVGFHLLGASGLPDRPLAFNAQQTVPQPNLGARAFFGRGVAGLGALRVGALNFTASDGLNTSVLEAAGQLGGGYHVEISPNLRLTPWLAAELGARSLGGVGAHTFILAGGGATFRADVTGSVSLLVEAAWFPAGYSAGFEALLTNTGPRLGVGVGFF